jgi:nitroimidazol reductase NimA-like FMN-containing flavoprotein (pyridoxamine 5'-phosphate oxidase superfamily)
MMMQPNELTEILNRPLSQELLSRDVTRLAYVAEDGTPRNVPIIFAWNGSEIVMCTPKNAPKLPALRANPAVALTIDTEVHPPTQDPAHPRARRTGRRRWHPGRVPESDRRLPDDA